jgi:hypothetical protein
MRLSEADALDRAAGADHGILATVHPARGADAVPACFVIEGEVIAIPIDRIKPKRSTTLQRTRNLEADPRATLLCEHWDAADWSRLWWVRLTLRRSVEAAATTERLELALRQRYPQYETEPFAGILTFRIVAVLGWAAGEGSGVGAPGRQKMVPGPP